MKNYILKDENAVYHECGFSCDNEIFIRIGNEAFFITDPRYTIEAKENITNAEVIEADRDLIKTARQILRSFHIKKIFYNPKEWNIDDFGKIKERLNTFFYPSPNFSQKKRIIKSDEEIKIIKKAAETGADLFDRISKYLTKNGSGKTEKLLHFEVENLLRDFGEYELSFSPIVALNENAAKPHALPTEKKMQNEDLILIDAGIKYKRYCSDRTRTAMFDTSVNFQKNQSFKDQKTQKIYDLVLKAQEAAIKKVCPGVKACDIDKAAREVIENGGYGKYFVHSTGHGVGLDIHELPLISIRSETVIEENMVFTIEPGIYIPDKFGIRIEDMVTVTNNGVEVL